ncbi:MAG: hypothetical protein V9G23_07615, partial [Giesbergeria sp.]
PTEQLQPHCDAHAKTMSAADTMTLLAAHGTSLKKFGQPTARRQSAPAAAAEKYHANRKQMTKEERALFVQEAIRHYAHPPHHAEGPQSQRWYSSSDAALCLGMASALLAEVIAGEDISGSDEMEPTT